MQAPHHMQTYYNENTLLDNYLNSVVVNRVESQMIIVTVGLPRLGRVT